MMRTLLGLDEVNVEVAAAMDHAEVELEDTIPVKEKKKLVVASASSSVEPTTLFSFLRSSMMISGTLTLWSLKLINAYMFLILHMFSLMKV